MKGRYKMKDDDAAGCLGVILLVIIITIAILQPYFESRAFNKFSRTKATYWDAVWSDLRIFPDGGGK